MNFKKTFQITKTIEFEIQKKNNNKIEIPHWLRWRKSTSLKSRLKSTFNLGQIISTSSSSWRYEPEHTWFDLRSKPNINWTRFGPMVELNGLEPKLNLIHQV